MQRTAQFRALVLLCSLCLLASLPALAEGNSCVMRGIADQTGLAPENIVYTEALHPPLFVELHDGAAIGDRLTFEILVDGAPYLTEEVELTSPTGPEKLLVAGTPVVELLAANEARLGHLYRLAESQQVEIALHRDGAVVSRHSLADLAAASALLEGDAISPHSLSSTLSRAATPPQKNQCRDWCDAEQDACYDYCGQFGSASCYNACDDNWADCMTNCGVCQPSTSSSTTYTTVSITYLGVNECRHSTPYGKGIYAAFHRRIKATTTTTTTHSDCSQTVTTQVSYFNILCWRWQYSSPFCISNGFITEFC